MKKIKYYFQRLFSMDYKAMIQTVKKIHKRSKKNSIIIFLDMIYCSFKYLAGYTDYFLFYFENLNNRQRSTYITRGVNNNYIKYLNDSNFYNYFRDKILFNDTFKEYIKRDYLDLNKASLEEFENFIKKHKEIMVKPIDSTGGFGIEKIVIDKKINNKKLYNELIEKKQFLVEECVKQHKEMDKLSASSVNTLRIVTIRKDDNVHIMLRCIRMGNGINAVDNFHSGGMYSMFDENGIIITDAVDRKGNSYEKHPFTHTKIKGFRIPYFKEAIDMCIKGSKVIPEIRYIGWDVAITNNGPVIIEGNELPGYDLYQSKVHLNDNNEGLKDVFDKIVYGK